MLRTICETSLQKGPVVEKKVFVDLNRAGHDKFVKKSVLA